MPSAYEIITKSMKILGALGQNEVPTSSEADDGLIALNDMLDSWSTDRTFIYTITQETFNLVQGQQSYTIGPGGDFNTTRPIDIDNLVVTFNGQDYPVQRINSQDYSTIPQKTLETGIPEYFYYDANFPSATLYLYGAPTSGGTISIGKWAQLSQFADLTTQYTFPPGYNRALRYNLAQEIAPEYMPLSPDAAKIAMDALANIRNRNLPDPVMKTEIGYMVGSYGLYQNGWNY
jgi:hypothetical protein